jgi:hypothetical protein
MNTSRRALRRKGGTEKRAKEVAARTVMKERHKKGK